MSQERDVVIQHDHVSHTGELIKFGVLAAVLIGAVLVVMVTRPLIFGRIVPAVMGTTGDTTTETVPAEGAPADPAPEDEAPAVEASPGVTTTETISPTTTTGSDGIEAEETPDLQVHVVKSGEYLALIAEQYGVSVQAIIDENNLTDPNRLFVGVELRIPASEE